MFERLFKRIFKSRNLLSPEEVIVLEEEVNSLNKEILTREKQIQKFKSLISEAPDNERVYIRRMKIHFDLIEEHKNRLKEIEIILLDK